MLYKFIPLIPLGGIFYRLRGGPLKDWFPKYFGTQLSRLVAWSIPTSVFMTIYLGLPVWAVAALTLSHWLSMVMVGTGQYLNDKDYDELKELSLFDLLGIARTAIAASPFIFLDKSIFIFYAISGTLHAAMYWLGHQTKYHGMAGEVFVGSYTWLVILLLAFINA